MSADQAWAYIGRTTKPIKHWPEIGTVVCSTIDEPHLVKDNAKIIAKWIRDGLTIERVPVEWVRKYLFTTQSYQVTL